MKSEGKTREEMVEELGRFLWMKMGVEGVEKHDVISDNWWRILTSTGNLLCRNLNRPVNIRLKKGWFPSYFYVVSTLDFGRMSLPTEKYINPRRPGWVPELIHV